MGFVVRGLGFGVWDLWFGVWFGVWGSWFGVWGLRVVYKSISKVRRRARFVEYGRRVYQKAKRRIRFITNADLGFCKGLSKN